MIIITAALFPVDVDNLPNYVNLVFLSLTFSLNLYSLLLIATLSTALVQRNKKRKMYVDDHLMIK